MGQIMRQLIYPLQINHPPPSMCRRAILYSSHPAKHVVVAHVDLTDHPREICGNFLYVDALHVVCTPPHSRSNQFGCSSEGVRYLKCYTKYYSEYPELSAPELREFGS